MTKKNIKFICTIAIFLFLVLQLPYFTLTLSSAISYAVSIAAILDILYDHFLWRYNPLEKTPRIFGTYEEHCSSTYKDGIEYTAKAIIRQTLSSITVHEYAEGSGSADSITATLIKSSDVDGTWRLYYTYLTHPAAGKSDDMHEGTVVLQIKNENELEGYYFTNRTSQTKGNQTMVRISKNTK